MSDHDMKMTRIIKIIECLAAAVTGVLAVVVFLADRGLRERAAADPMTLLLFLLVWAAVLILFLTNWLDFRQRRKEARAVSVLRDAAYMDHLTGMPNRAGFDYAMEEKLSAEDLKDAGAFLYRLRNIRAVNTSNGTEAGDELLSSFSRMFRDIGSRYGYTARNGGNEFLAVLPQCTEEKRAAFDKDLQEALDAYNEEHPAIQIEAVHTACRNSELGFTRLPELVRAVYGRFREEYGDL